MHRVMALIENTYKECIRQRIMLLIIVFSIILIIVSIFLGPFALGESSKILRDLGLAAYALFGALVVIIIGSSLVHKDIEKRTIYAIITTHVRRFEIILGKFLGLIFLITVLIISMACIQQILILLYEGNFDFKLLAAIPFTIIEVMVLLGILLFFSSYSSPSLAAIMGVIFYVIGHASPDLKLFADQVKVPLLKYCAYLIYYTIPNLENFNFRLELVHNIPIKIDQILFSASYGLIYVIFLLYLSIIVFEKREFK